MGCCSSARRNLCRNRLVGESKMEEKEIIYVAGNPNAYPLEYYDEDAGVYQGVIPELLRQFSQQSSYQMIYYQGGTQDQRAQLAKNRQVDILSGYTQTDEAPSYSQPVTVFNSVWEGEQSTYQIYVSDVAPEALKSQLESYFASVGEETLSGVAVHAAVQYPTPHALYWSLAGLGLAAAALAAAVILLVRRYRKMLRKAEQSIETDEVTGIGNAEYLTRYYMQFVLDKNRILYKLCYFYVDTDQLRRLSSSEETNEFLRYVATLLQEYTGDSDILARVSDQGFVLVKLSGSAQADEEWLTSLIARARAYSEKYQKPFDVNLSAGIYPIKASDRDLNEMVFNAGQSARAAAQNGMGYMVCSDQMLQQFVEERRLQASIERALSHQEFELYLQFYLDCDAHRIVGGEALSRWQHPEKGLLAPDRFVPMMEREGKISKLDYYSLEKVCAFMEELVRLGIDTFFISCNFSRDTFAAADFVDNCKRIMGQYSFPRELLIFEITESTSSKNTSQLQQNAIALKEYGVKIALDDFGKGFTSFYDLQLYPIDGIKLDKSLIDNLGTERGNAILKAMVHVGHELGITILAEGVETDAQVEVISRLHCDVLQGFRFFYPMPHWEAKKKILQQFKPTRADNSPLTLSAP